MLNLTGSFLREDKPCFMCNGNVLVFPISLVFPNKERLFYLIDKEERNNWLKNFKLAIGYSNLHDYYELAVSYLYNDKGGCHWKREIWRSERRHPQKDWEESGCQNTKKAIHTSR